MIKYNFEYSYNDISKNFEIEAYNSTEGVISKSLKRFLTATFNVEELQNYYKSFCEIHICIACMKSLTPYDIKIKLIDNNIKIVSIKKYEKKYQYCYGQSKECKEEFQDKNPNSAYYISRMLNISIEDAKLHIRKNNKSPFYKENFSNIEAYKDYQKRDISFFVKKYGEIIGSKKYEESINKQTFSKSKDGFIKRFGQEDGTLRFEKYSKDKDSMSLTHIKKNNPSLSHEECMLLRNERRKSVTYNKEKYIKKHGIDKLLKLEAARKNRPKVHTPVSKWSLRLIDGVCKNITPCDNIIMKFGSKNEYSILDVEKNRKYYYDLFFQKNEVRKIIEFNGKAFHAHPDADDIKKQTWKNVRSKSSWSDSLNYDKRKIEVANLAGIQTLILWDSVSDEENIKLAVEFLSD